MSAVDPSGRALIIPSSGGAPSGAAGGDLGGTYPNPTVTDLTIASETRGDLLRRNASAWGRFAANTADTFVGGDGTDVVARTAAQARASILGPFADGMTGTGWSNLTPSGGASATWATGPARLFLDCPSGTTGSCGVERAGYLPSPEWSEFAIRLQVLSGDASSNTRVGFNVGKDANNTANFTLWTNGNVEPAYVSGGSYTSLTTTAPSAIDSTARTGGNLWFKVSHTPAALVWSYGIGTAGAQPTSWVPIYQTTNATALAVASGTFVQVYSLTIGSIDFDVDVLAIKSALPGGF